MEFKYYIDKERKIVIRAFYGEVSLNLLEESLKIVWNDPEYDPTFNGLADFRECKMLFSKERLLKIIKVVADNVMSLQGKVAILVTEPISAAMATIYEEKLERISKVEVFCYTSNAAEFLQVNVNILDSLNNIERIVVE